jgi:hypothetical protein
MNVVFEVRFRPLRFAWCIDANSADEFITAVELSCKLAGGTRNPIIPVGTDVDAADSLVRSFDLDCLIGVHRSARVEQFLQKYPELSPPFDPFFLDNEDEETPFSELDSFYTVGQLLGVEAIGEQGSKRAVHEYVWDANDDYSLLLWSLFGRGKKQYYRERLAFKKVELKRRTWLPALDSYQLNPVKVSAQRVSSLKDEQRHGEGAIFLFSTIDVHTASELWNLQATGIKVLPVRAPSATRLKRIEDTAKSWAKQKPFRIPRRPWLVASSSFVGAIPADFGNLKQITVSNLVAKEDSLGYFDHSESAVAREVTAGGARSFFMEIPTGPFIRNMGWNESLEEPPQSVMVALFPEGDLEQGSEFTMHCLPIRSLNLKSSVHLRHQNSKTEAFCRTTRDGVSLLCSEFARFIEIRPFRKADMVAELLASAGFAVGFSDAGARSMQMIRQMGGLEGCELFRQAGVRKVLGEFKVARHLSEQQLFKNLHKAFMPADTIALSPSKKERLVEEVNNACINTLRELVDRKVLQVGLWVRCPRCLIPDWLSMKRIEEPVECEMCGDSFSLYGQHRDWQFRRAGLFNPYDDQGGGIPVSLTIAQLIQCKWWAHRELFFAGLKVTDATLNFDGQEIDFVMAYFREGEQLEILLGECKGQVFPDINDLQVLAAIAQRVRERLGAKTYVVLAGFGQLTEPMLDAIVDVMRSTPVIVLRRDELENRDLSTAVREQFDWPVCTTEKLAKYCEGEIRKLIVAKILGIMDRQASTRAALGAATLA